MQMTSLPSPGKTPLAMRSAQVVRRAVLLQAEADEETQGEVNLPRAIKLSSRRRASCPSRSSARVVDCPVHPDIEFLERNHSSATCSPGERVCLSC